MIQALLRIVERDIIEGNKPNVPANLTAIGLDRSVVISWGTNPAGLTDIVLEKSIDGVNFTQHASVSTSELNLNDTSYTDTGLQTNKAYWYRLKYINQYGDSVYAGPRKAITLSNDENKPGFGQAVLLNAYIPSNAPDELHLMFDENVFLTNADGWRLVGGMARIESLKSGSGTKNIVFNLTDFALKDDVFQLLHWPELSDANSPTGRLGKVIFNVSNDVTDNVGTIYYVSTSGDDSNDGLTEATAKRTPNAALQACQPGDKVLCQRGDYWPETSIRFPRAGTAGNYISVGAYGTGAKPKFRIFARNNTEAVLMDKSFTQIDNLNIEASSNKNIVVYRNACNSCITSNCRVRGYEEAFAGDHKQPRTAIEYCEKHAQCINPIIINNEASHAFWCIGSSGYELQLSGGEHVHNVYGGLIEYNFTHDNEFKPSLNAKADDGIHAGRINGNGLIIRKNRVTRFRDDGIDCFASKNITIEYNEVWDPQNGAANGIKGGGRSPNVSPNYSGRDVIIRYNYVHDVRILSNYGITNNNNTHGKIYGNLVVNSRIGIKLDGPIVDYEIFNNTVLLCDIAFETYTTGSGFKLYNNILQGSQWDINPNTRGSGNGTGGDNICINGKVGGNYTGTNDIRGMNVNSLFADFGGNDYRLKEGSPAVDRGRDAPDHQRSFEGLDVYQIHDVGCFEYIPASEETTTLYIAGDSLWRNRDTGRQGMGEVMSNYFKDSCTIVNLGNEGESSKSFYNDLIEGAYIWKDLILAKLKAGDKLIVSFAHNDQQFGNDNKETSIAEYKSFLRKYFDEANAKGVEVIFSTPLRRMKSGTSLGGYPNAMIEVAEEKNAILVDLHAESSDTFVYISEADVDQYFRVSDNISETDQTHLGDNKAFRGVLMWITRLNQTNSTLRGFLKESYKSFVWDKTDIPSNV